MKNSKISAGLYKKNREKICSSAEKNSVIIVHSGYQYPRNADQFYKYRPHSDFYYLTGIEQEKSILVMCPGHPDEKYREILYILRPDEKMQIWEGYKLTREEASGISGINEIKWGNEFENDVDFLVKNKPPVYLNMPEKQNCEPVLSQDFNYSKILFEKHPLLRSIRLSTITTPNRLIKEYEELALIKKAVEVTGEAFKRVCRTTKPEMFEYEIEAEINYVFSKNGCGHAYLPIVASGANACVLHYITNREKCKKGDLVLLDFGAEFENYASDCSRTIPVSGKFTKRQKDCYNAVLRVFRKTVPLFVPGNTINKINQQVKQWLGEEMIGLGLFTSEDVKKQSSLAEASEDNIPENPLVTKYFMHGVSHFMGLDVHDPGSKDEPLKKGMVVTCEPGLYIKEEGIGIRIENNILVDEMPVDLMAGIPIGVEEVERMMGKSGD